MQATKDKSILFTAEMVRAILAGTKTQTRRMIKPQPAPDETGRWSFIVSSTNSKSVGKFSWSVLDETGDTVAERGIERETQYKSPYGLAGDRLWVKETFCPRYWGIEFRADVKPENEIEVAEIMQKYGSKWKSARFMPRTASRITLEIVSVKVERLQDISEGDAKAEGASCTLWYQPHGKSERNSINLSGTAISAVHPSHCKPNGISYRNGFATLWDDINGKKEGCDWESNPFVFAIEFKRIEA